MLPCPPELAFDLLHTRRRADEEESSTVKLRKLIQSSEAQAGTTPTLLNRPSVGFRPTMLLNAAGSPPEPAVSITTAKLTRPAATATAEPELEPSRDVGGVKYVLAGPIRTTITHESRGELVEVCLADGNGAGGLESLDHRGGSLRHTSWNARTSSSRRMSGQIDVVLDGEGNAK